MTCVASIDGVCNGHVAHHHHRKRRSQGGKDDHPNVIGLCFACHEHIHNHPLWARSYGLLLPSWEDPDAIEPVSYGHPRETGPYGAT